MKRFIAAILFVALMCSFVPATFAATSEASEAAQALYDLGLFQGTGNNADGTPNFDLDRTPTRAEAVTMLVRLLGKDAEAKVGTWETPFTDVADWAKPYVGYAYANGLTTGTSDTTFGGDVTVNATQYLTFVLRALGYTSGTDFQWDSAWTKSDEIKLTDGRYNASTASFTRGDVAVISNAALSAEVNGQNTPLSKVLGIAQKGLTVEDLQGIWESEYKNSWTTNTRYEYVFDGNNYIRSALSTSTNTMNNGSSCTTHSFERIEGTYEISGDHILFSGERKKYGELPGYVVDDYFDVEHCTFDMPSSEFALAGSGSCKKVSESTITSMVQTKIEEKEKAFATRLYSHEELTVRQSLSKAKESLSKALPLAKNAGAVGLNSIILGMGVSSPYKTEKERAEVEAVAKGNVIAVKSLLTAVIIDINRIQEIFEKKPGTDPLVAKLTELERLCQSISDTPVSLDSDTLTEMLDNLTSAVDLFIEIHNAISNEYLN